MANDKNAKLNVTIISGISASFIVTVCRLLDTRTRPKAHQNVITILFLLFHLIGDIDRGVYSLLARHNPPPPPVSLFYYLQTNWTLEKKELINK